jgi:hypothetical protein
MKRMCARSILAAALLSAPVLVLTAGPAAAHEHRHVAGGKYDFTVGWGDEPTYTGLMNSVSLALKDANGKPINDLGDTLKVEVTSGGMKATFPIKPDFEIGEFGTPGDYRARLIPTRPGTYLFHFTGTIKGDPIDETFTSSETTFDSVDDAADISFPVKDPSTGELAARIDKEVPRLTAADKKAKDDATSARVFGIVGIALGAVALATGVARSRRA